MKNGLRHRETIDEDVVAGVGQAHEAARLLAAHGGVWTPCPAGTRCSAGSVTRWQSHLGSEEHEPDAKAFYEGGDVSMITRGGGCVTLCATSTSTTDLPADCHQR